jgi:hypothetical protein
MAVYSGNQEMKDRLRDMHNGLHMAMQEIIKNKNYQKGELILRQLDAHISDTLNNMKMER